MVNLRKKGSAFEYKVRDLLKKEGFFVVRSTVSKFPDLIAIPPNEINDKKLLPGERDKQIQGWIWDDFPVFVECKSRKGGLTRKEKGKFEDLKLNYNITAVVAYPKHSVYSSKKDNIIFEEVE